MLALLQNRLMKLSLSLSSLAGDEAFKGDILGCLQLVDN